MPFALFPSVRWRCRIEWISGERSLLFMFLPLADGDRVPSVPWLINVGFSDFGFFIFLIVERADLAKLQGRRHYI